MIKLILLSFIFYPLIALSQTLINPLLTYIDLHKAEEITNLTPSIDDKVEIIQDSDLGYSFLATKKIYISAGAMAVRSVQLSDSQWGYMGFGLYPSYNSFAKMYRHYDKLENLKNRELQLPDTAEKALNAKNGDWTYWSVQGGITFNPLVGISQYGLGPKIGLEGGFSIYVEKKKRNIVYVEIRKVKTRSIGLLAGSFYAFAEVTKVVDKTKGFAFSLDLSEEKDKKLYDDLMQRGRLDLIQEEHSQKVAEIESHQNKIVKKIGVGTPFIPLISLQRHRSSGEFTQTREDIWDNFNQTKISSTLIHKTRRLFKRYSYEDMTVNLSSDSNLQIHFKKFGNRFRYASLIKLYRRLMRKTALSSFFEIDFPSKNQKIEHAKVELILELPADVVLFLKQYFNSSDRVLTKKLSYVWKNPLLFQKIFKLAQACSGKMQLDISGVNLTHYNKSYNFVANDQCEIEKDHFRF